ncbi:MAG: UDP-2,3-diacylglucosamine diphosphatase [Rhodothermaceae bacterium]|nr:UDP-2,3-diacylglucosamine diphosphatase [Rhodothermaceae bacterium]
MSKRPVDLVVISDVHLGTYGCHAAELNRYLKSIKPGILILNGDIMDMWQFKKYYWPDSHMKVLKTITSLLSKGTVIYYLTGNHDENLRKFSDFKLGNFHLRDKLLIELNGKTAWFFHGDVFDVTMRYSKTVAKLGGFGYDLLILLNRLVNFISCKLGRGKMSFSKSIKDGVKSAVKFIDDFENTATDLAIDNGYEYVVCGHIHRPVIKRSVNGTGSVTYLNSGDWVENLTSLEYHNDEWVLYRYDEKHLPIDSEPEPEPEIQNGSYFEMNHEIFEHIISNHP